MWVWLDHRVVASGSENSMDWLGSSESMAGQLRAKLKHYDSKKQRYQIFLQIVAQLASVDLCG
jgi:hypothetical protein